MRQEGNDNVSVISGRKSPSHTTVHLIILFQYGHNLIQYFQSKELCFTQRLFKKNFLFKGKEKIKSTYAKCALKTV